MIVGERSSILTPERKVKLRHWRALRYVEDCDIVFRESANDYQILTGLFLITYDCQEYYFDGMDIQTFFRCLRKEKPTKWKNLKYRREVLVCPNCGGCGKTDWVRAATNNPIEYDFRHRTSFKQIPNKYKLCKQTGYYFTQALVDDLTQEHCGMCGGTGLRFVKPSDLEDVEQL